MLKVEPFRGRYGLSSALVLSFVIKLAIFAVGIAIIGLFNTRTSLIACSSTPGNAAVFNSPFADAEAYTDYRDLYLRCLVNPFLGGSGAYNLPIVYNYPPLFLYTLAAFALENIIWFPAIPLVLFDILTVIPIYLIAKEFLFNGNQKLAFAISILWIANPINLFYNDLLWLNPGPTTFFLVLSIYLFMKEKWIYSSAALAVSTGFKQIGVLLFPIFLVVMWKTSGFSKKLLVYAAVYIGLLVLISTPYIFQTPALYFWALQLPVFGLPPGVSMSPPTFQYDLSEPVRLTTFLGLVRFADLKSLALFTYQFLSYIFVGLYAALLMSLILKKEKLSKNDLLVYCFAAFLLFFSFFGRGVYKYYFAQITPLALPLFSFRRGAIIFEVVSLVLLFIPRVVNPWVAILLLTFLPGITSKTLLPQHTTGQNA